MILKKFGNKKNSTLECNISILLPLFQDKLPAVSSMKTVATALNNKGKTANFTYDFQSTPS